MRILLVEDSMSLCDVLKTVLQKEKYEVQIANDGESGLNYALADIYDLIILDVMMPKKNGFDVLTELRKQRITTPIIMLDWISARTTICPSPFLRRNFSRVSAHC